MRWISGLSGVSGSLYPAAGLTGWNLAGYAFFGVIVSGLLALGGLLLFHRRARFETRMFGGFILVIGTIQMITLWMHVFRWWPDFMMILYLAGSILASFALAWFVYLYPIRLSRAEWPLVALAVAGGFAFVSLEAVRVVERMYSGGIEPLGAASSFSYLLFALTLAASQLLLALRFKRSGRANHPAAEHGLVALGVFLFGMGWILVSAALTTAFGFVEWSLAVFLLVALITGIWVFNSSLEAPASRVARNLAWAIPGVALGVLATIFLQREWFWDELPSLAQILAVVGTIIGLGLLLVAYPLVRRDFLGVALKMRWGVSKGYLAGFFIAVFFVAGEAAESFFGNALGTYVGIVAAGLLVFAISPMQRLADRLTRHTVPAAFSGTSHKRREEIYRHALRGALKDRKISEKEEIRLAELAEELGIGAGRAALLISEARNDLQTTPASSGGTS